MVHLNVFLFLQCSPLGETHIHSDSTGIICRRRNNNEKNPACLSELGWQLRILFLYSQCSFKECLLLESDGTLFSQAILGGCDSHSAACRNTSFYPVLESFKKPQFASKIHEIRKVDSPYERLNQNKRPKQTKKAPEDTHLINSTKSPNSCFQKSKYYKTFDYFNERLNKILIKMKHKGAKIDPVSASIYLMSVLVRSTFVSLVSFLLALSETHHYFFSFIASFFPFQRNACCLYCRVGHPLL